jgi:hypothetical protein
MDLRERTSLDARRHPWESVRSVFFGNKIVALAKNQPVHVLDIGSGDCWFSEQLLPKLPKGSHITCADPNFTNEDMASSVSGINKVREIPQQLFDLVIMLDVLEHIEDDKAFLTHDVLPRLKPESNIVISVPAHPSLFTSHDVFLGHHRRYTRRQLLSVSRAFFRTHEHGYLFTSLALVRLLQRLTASSSEKSESGVGNWHAGALVTGLVTIALFVDVLISRILNVFRVRVPGLTVWTICSSNRSVTHQ